MSVVANKQRGVMKIVFQTADETLLVRNENGEMIVNVERLLGLGGQHHYIRFLTERMPCPPGASSWDQLVAIAKAIVAQDDNRS